jgi:hypothetical protein
MLQSFEGQKPIDFFGEAMQLPNFARQKMVLLELYFGPTQPVMTLLMNWGTIPIGWQILQNSSQEDARGNRQCHRPKSSNTGSGSTTQKNLFTIAFEETILSGSA